MALIAGYGFGEVSGTVATDVTGNYPGTVSGATRTSAGKYGPGLSFDGSNDLVTIPHADPLTLASGFTLMAWVNPKSLTNWRTVVLKEATGNHTYALYASNGSVPAAHLIVGGSDLQANGASALPLNAWTHLAATWDGGTLRLFVDGILRGSASRTGTVASSTGRVVVGGNGVWGEYFQGTIDDVRVYSTEFSAAEISTAMASPVDPGLPPAIPTSLMIALLGGVRMDWAWVPDPGSSGSPSGWTVELQAPNASWAELVRVGGGVATQSVGNLILDQFYGFRVTPSDVTLSAPVPVVRAAVRPDGTLEKE